jgi:hypothetical protein
MRGRVVEVIRVPTSASNANKTPYHQLVILDDETGTEQVVWPSQVLHEHMPPLACGAVFRPSHGYEHADRRNQSFAYWTNKLNAKYALVLDGATGGTQAELKRVCGEDFPVFSVNNDPNDLLYRAVAGDKTVFVPRATKYVGRCEGVVELIGLALSKPEACTAVAVQAASADALAIDMYGCWKSSYDDCLERLGAERRKVIFITYCTRNSAGSKPSVPVGYTVVYEGQKTSMKWIIMVPDEHYYAQPENGGKASKAKGKKENTENMANKQNKQKPVTKARCGQKQPKKAAKPAAPSASNPEGLMGRTVDVPRSVLVAHGIDGDVDCDVRVQCKGKVVQFLRRKQLFCVRLASTGQIVRMTPLSTLRSRRRRCVA